jgi:hypothetical protein
MVGMNDELQRLAAEHGVTDAQLARILQAVGEPSRDEAANNAWVRNEIVKLGDRYYRRFSRFR